MADFNAWLNSVEGRHVDVDGYYGAQCVDVDLSFAQFCFVGVAWTQTIGQGDAKDLFAAASPSYFEKLKGIIARQGDIVVYGPTSTNPYGHTAVVISADSSGMELIEQDGFNPGGVAYRKRRSYNNVIGFLRPKVNLGGEEMPTPEQVDVEFQAVFNRRATADEVAYWTKRSWDEFVKYCLKNSLDQRTKMSNFDRIDAARIKAEAGQAHLDKTLQAAYKELDALKATATGKDGERLKVLQNTIDLALKKSKE